MSSNLTISDAYSSYLLQKIVIEETFPEFVLQRREKFLEELLIIRIFFFNSKKLKFLLKNKEFSNIKKAQFFINYIPKISALVKKFLTFMARNGHIKYLLVICTKSINLIYEQKSTMKIKLIISGILFENVKPKLLNKLRSLLKAKFFILEICYGSKILGGIILECNSKRFNINLLEELKF